MKSCSSDTVRLRMRDFTSPRRLFLNSAAGIALFAAAAGGASALPLPQLGVYRGPAPGGPVNATNYSTWLNQPDMWGLDFMSDADWYQIQGPSWILNPWRDWLAANPARRFILSVPMLPQSPSTASLATGATGAYNSNFATLAENLISRNMGNTIIRPGWEFNGGWYKWAANGKQAHFINYWRHIVNSMRYLSDGVTPRPGANFQFLWNPNHGYNQFPAEQAYPGDAYVDLIGSDVYDQSWMPDPGSTGYKYPWPAGSTQADIDARRQAVWTDDILNGNHGLVFWRNFCATHNKPFVLPEWGVMTRTDGHGGQDNPAFITNMHNYMTTYPVAWAAYFDADNSIAKHKLSPTATLPDASARFLQLFGVSAGSSSREAAADSYVRDGAYATGNFGAETTMSAKLDAAGFAREAYVRFDVSGLAEASSIKIVLTPTAVGSDAATTTLSYDLLSSDSWSETGITWNNRSTAGAVLAAATGYAAGQALELDVTNEARSEAAGDGLLSLRIRSTTSGSQRIVTFGSRENASSIYRPVLIWSDGAALLTDAFSDGNADGWTATPSARWSVVTDAGDPAYKFDFDWNNTTGISTAGNTSWTNYTMTVDFKITDFQSYSETRFFFRYASGTNHYCLEARENGGSRRLVLTRVVNGAVTDLATYYTTLAVNTWYVVGITANGSSLSVTFNGAPAIQVTDASITAGKIGLGSYKQDVLFDNVTVD